MSQAHGVGDWIENRFEVFDIHRGGMGLVYVVCDHRVELGHPVVALKTLRDEFLNDPRQAEYFIRECRTWIQLDAHPFLVRAYSVQMLEGKPYVVLELVTGGSLRRWIGSPKLDLAQSLRLLVQLCLAMEHAARKGVDCHLDLKPENLLLTPSGSLKVTDFGLAKLTEVRTVDEGLAQAIPLSDAGPFPPIVVPVSTLRPIVAANPGLPLVPDAAPSAVVAERLDETAAWALGAETEPSVPGTMNGRGELDTEPIATAEAVSPRTTGRTVMGTTLYMAPEQFRGIRQASVRSDIYATGIILFEMLTGRTPFRGESVSRLARLHTEEPPPSLVRYIPGRHGSLAREIDRIDRRCLAKAPDDRFASFAELRRALEPLLLEAGGEPVRPPTMSDLDAWELNSKAVSLGNLGRSADELRAYEATFRACPDFVPAWFNKSAALGSLGHLAEALDHAEMALNLHRRSVPAMINKGLSLHGMNRCGEAIACLDAALYTCPGDPDVWRARGLVLAGIGNLEGARVALEQARRLRPGKDLLADRLLAGEGAIPVDQYPWVRRIEDTPGDSSSSLC